MKNSFFIDYLMEIPNFLSLFIFAFFMMMTSPILLDISDFFKVKPENMNLIITFLNIGVIIGLITSIFLNRKFSKNHIIIIAYLTAVPILVILGLTKSLIIFNILYFVLGYFFGLAWINANSNLVESRVKNKDSVVNFGHSFFAFGALIAPFVSIGLINSNIRWNTIYFITVFLVLAAVLSYIIILKKKKITVLSGNDKKPIKGLFKYKNKNIFFLFSVILMIIYVMSETIIGTWAPTFFRVQKMFSLSNAGLILTVFYIGMLIGRVGISFLSYRVKARYIMIGSSLVSIIALILAIFINNTLINILAIGFVGLGFSGFAPLVLSTTSSAYNINKDIVVTIIFFFGLSGNALAPFLTKLISSSNMVFSLALTIFLMIAVLLLTLIRVFYKKKYIKE
jgi:MFS transporter, FHS family, glucose/mannose:H+ symporter